MTNREALLLLDASRRAFIDIDNYTFGMAITDAEKQLEKTEVLLNKVKEPTKEYKKYTKAVQELYQENSLKNPDGSYQTKGDGENKVLAFDPKNKDKYQKEKAKLDELYKTAIKLQNEKNEKYQDMLEEETQFTPEKIDEKQMPRKILTPYTRIAVKLLDIKRTKK